MEEYYKVASSGFQYSDYLEPILNSIFENIIIEELDYFVEYEYYAAFYNDKFHH